MGKLLTQYLDIRGAKLTYREHGSGPALILLHGNSARKEMFTKYQTVHFNMFHTVAIDSRGHGETRSTDAQYSISQFSDDVIGLCKAKGIMQAAVIGYSDGGNIAILLANKEPQIFRKIVAISPNYLVSGTTDGTLRFLRAITQMLRILERFSLPTHKAIMRCDLMLNDIGISAQELGNINTSLRILYAENDMIKETHIQEMGALIPGATIKKIKRCNHLTIFYKKETIADIREYLMRDG